MSGDVTPVGCRLSVLPNPAHGSTRVSYSLPRAGNARVSLYNAIGALVATPASGRICAGDHTATIDAGRLALGVYVLKLDAGGFSATSKLIVE